VDDGVVADRDAVSYMDLIIGVGVYGSVVLNITVVSDRDRVGVAADDGIVPDACVFAQVDITDDMRSRRDKYILVHDRCLLLHL